MIEATANFKQVTTTTTNSDGERTTATKSVPRTDVTNFNNELGQ